MCALAAAACAAAYYAHAKELALSIEDLRAPAFSAQSLRASLTGPALRELTLDIDRLTVAGRTWRNVKLACPALELPAGRIACARGVLDLGEKIPVSFSYATGERDLLVELKPAADEAWRIAGRVGGADTALEIKIDRGRLDRLASWLPAAAPKLGAGRASGTISLKESALEARLTIDGVAFSDTSGLHAGEKIGAALEADAAAKGDEWRWSARLAWRSGEVYWQPVFVAAGGQRLQLEGTTAHGVTNVRAGRLDLPGVGAVELAAQWDHANAALTALEARATRLRIGALYEHLLKAPLQGTALSDLRAEGEVTFAASLGGSGLKAIDADLKDVSFEDRQRRFALFGATGKVSWRRDEAGTGELFFKGAEFLKLPVGAARVALRLRGSSVAIDHVRVPILDGALTLRNFRAGTTEDGWRWRFSGELAPISMVELSQAVGMPVMHGLLSGVIPEVRYRRGTLAMDGALVIRAFDGTISASSVQLIEPFGRVPRLHAELDMKDLDLELLTRAFDFGTITGRIDARVRGLELVNWQPMRFDARVESSPGTYPRKISQRAVQNISALGGAGAAAAIQQSFLRFFEQFGYARLGLSCRLENNICEMDGIERAPQGYVIVKGGGVPAISVIGYNRQVSWRELVGRLKRITDDNVKPIVK